MTITEMKERLTQKAATDQIFREQLISNPNTAIKEELNITIPDGFKVIVHEDTQEINNFVLPPPAILEEEEMEQVSGGAVYRWSNRKNNGAGGYVRVDELATFWDDFDPRYE